MDAAVSSTLGAMGPLLRKLDLLLAPEYKLRKQVKDGIELVKEDLEEVSSALVDLSMVNNPRQRAKCWMEEARELSYDIEDFVEGMMLPCTHADADAKMRSVRRWRVGRVKVPRLPVTPKLRTRMAKIAHFRSLLQEASDRHQRYQLHLCGSSPSRIVSELGRVPALYGDATNLVGIGDPRTELINMVAMEEGPELKVLSIVGPAGVGKTTLAKEAFRQLGGQFECRAFVRASRKPGIRRLLGSILSQVQGCHQTPPDCCPVQNLVDTLRAHLQVKRYLIVIDDLWDKTAWDIVRSAFPEANNCNRVITTTENMNVALEFCSYLPSNILKMKPLGIHDSRKLFISRVFGSEHQCPDEKKELSDGIIRRCGGLPLAIISLAGLLANQSEKLWYHVRDCLLSIPCRSHTMQKETLSLSYNSLPHYLKACLLYFKMYPEDCIIWKVDLVKQWIAEGFINATEGQDTQKVAQTYFDELVTRGMIQPMQINYNDEVLSCTVHNAIHDLITHGSKEENFTAEIDYSQPITRLCTKVRRLSLHFTSARYAKQPAGITMPQLRSLAFFGLLKCMPSIAEFKLLRILILEFLENQEGHTSLDLSTIFRFLLLRYLKVSGDIMVDLPAQMQGLKYLETLEINARHCAVPSDIVHLPSLLHLGLQGAAKLPDGIGCIRSLITLHYFDIGHNSEENVWSLGELTNLRHLHLTCSVLLSSEHLMRKLIPLFSSLGKLGNLKSLTLAPGALGMPVFVDITRSIYTPRSFSLQILELLPPICFFFRLPNWIGQLHTLGILKIGISELRENDINNLAGLPSLMVLSLYVRVAPDGPIVFTNMSFPALKYLKVRCGEMYLTFQEGAMSNIQRLKLCFNANRGENYGLVLKGIEYLSNLQEICGRIGAGIGANESDVKSAESVFQDTIRKHPTCRSFNVKRVDLIQEKYIAEKQHLRQQEGSSGEHHIPVRDYTEDPNKHAGSRWQDQLHAELSYKVAKCSMQAMACNHPYKCSAQMPCYINSVPSGENGGFYGMQNNLDYHYSSDDGSQRINNSNPRVSEVQYCTLESSSTNVVYPAQSSTSSHSISPISGSPLSQHDSHSDHTYSSPPTASCLTEVPDLHIKLKELENAILGPELDIFSDSPESFLQTNVSLRPDNWKQLLGIDTGDLKQVIIACGKAVAENDDVFWTELLISELGQLVSVSGDPMQRLGAYMLEGIVARLSSSGSMLYKSLKCKEPTSSELMSYMHLLYEICPFFKLGYMSANGAIAEAIKGENFVHIIDFQIAQGSQWATLIQALAARPGGPPCIRITGIDDSNSAYARGGGLDIVGMRLHKVAQSCDLPFQFNAVPAASHEVELEHLDIRPGEVIAVNFAYQLHHVPDESVSVENHRDRIIRMIRSINPRVVTLVEQESNTNTAPFFSRYLETLDYYTAMFESIDVALPRDDRRRISTEQHCVARDIVNLIACEGAERVERHEPYGKWKARFQMAGFRPYPLSSVVNSTIKTLLQSYNSYYRLEERDGVLYLGWKHRVLVVSSAWC